VIVPKWNFNTPVTDGSTGTGTTIPSIGVGTAMNESDRQVWGDEFEAVDVSDGSARARRHRPDRPFTRRRRAAARPKSAELRIADVRSHGCPVSWASVS
jgi:hypothetical protein